VSDGPVKTAAVAAGLPLFQPEKLKRDVIDEPLRGLSADLGVVAAYGKILPEWLIEIPRLGMINVHASLLPKYRGAAPVHRAVMAGETETGVTIMRVIKALDAGPMLARATRPIGIDESSEVVERDLAVMGARLLVAQLDALAEGRVQEIPQHDADATYASRLVKDEGRINWQRPAGELHNHVRGLRPWPGAFTFLNGQRLAIHQARLGGSAADALPGTCVSAGQEAIVIACGDGQTLNLLQVQPDGRRVMSARDFVAGMARVTGQRFG
jgi:methionyl-tRNA formyltransferase